MFFWRMVWLAADGSRANADSRSFPAGLSVGLPSGLVARAFDRLRSSSGVMALNTDGSLFNLDWIKLNWAMLLGVNRLAMVVPGRMVNMVTIGSPPNSDS